MKISNMEAVARAAHEANRAYCMTLGEPTTPWDDVSAELRASTLDAVNSVLDGCDAEELHHRWMKRRLVDGWTIGPVKDEEKKISPALVPFHQLPVEQRRKSVLFIAVVRSMAHATGAR